ncbi:hypothetical protein GCM10010486_20640 [Nonomuraea roseoviolacea subsp. carminata]
MHGRYRPVWWKLERRAALEASESYALDPAFRLWLLAVGRAYQGGHATFSDGEIIDLLPKVKKGVVSQYDPKQIKRLISALVDGGMLAPQSTPRCLVVPFTLLSAEWKFSPEPCPTHGHNMSWTADGWFDPATLADLGRRGPAASEAVR